MLCWSFCFKFVCQNRLHSLTFLLIYFTRAVEKFSGHKYWGRVGMGVGGGGVGGLAAFMVGQWHIWSPCPVWANFYLDFVVVRHRWVRWCFGLRSVIWNPQAWGPSPDHHWGGSNQWWCRQKKKSSCAVQYLNETKNSLEFSVVCL